MNSYVIIAWALLVIPIISCSEEKKTSPGTPRAGTPNPAARPVTDRHVPLKVDTLTPGMVPAELGYTGKLKLALGFGDGNGRNVVITTVSEPRLTGGKAEGDPEYHSDLQAWQYVKRDTGWALLWKLADNMTCSFDLTLEYIPGGTTVTDLDSNGVAETTLIYKLACRSDVSPAEIKLIMHENDRKFALRGTMYLNLSGMEDASLPKPEKPNESNICCLDDMDLSIKKMDEYQAVLITYGKYHTDRDFRGAPPAFLAFAKRQWLGHVEEKFQ